MDFMKHIRYFIYGLLCFFCQGQDKKLLKQEIFTDTKVAHTLWNNLLQRHVDDMGNVCYVKLKEEEVQLQNYLDYLAQNPPTTMWSRDEILAYYINLYNAATVKLIVDHYPVQSIKDIPNRWQRQWIAIGNITTSLNNIEHEVLRKMNEPRIHFAINCASYSCPQLLNTAFTAEHMEQMLAQATVIFVNDTQRNRFTAKTAQLSKIFKWYAADFTKQTTLLAYINKYLASPIQKDAKIDYLDYDWRLNEAK